MISKEKIWEKIEKKQEEKRRRAEIEADKNDLKEFICEQTGRKRGKEEERKRRKKKGGGLDREEDEEREKGSEEEGEKGERRWEGPSSQKKTVSQTSLTSNENQSSGEEYEEDEDFIELFQNVKDIKRFLQVPSTTKDLIAENTQLREIVESLENKVSELESINHQLKKEIDSDNESRPIPKKGYMSIII